MKTRKRHLKKGVKVAIIVIIAMVIIGGLIAIDRHNTEKAINSCINAGHERSYCVNGLK